MTAVRRSMAVTEIATPTIVVPKGRSAAERRLAAIAALHQPIVIPVRRILADEPHEYRTVCNECVIPDGYGKTTRAPWPCTTARLLGPWPGEVDAP